MRNSRRRIVRRAAAAALLSAAWAAGADKAGTRPLERLDSAQRLALLRKARVWHATDVAAADLGHPPPGKGRFEDRQPVTCRYDHKLLGGHSPKFACRFDDGDVVKVKYGVDNGEVYAAVAATRLLTALGFGADRVYPVKVTCLNCPVAPAHDRLATTGVPQEFLSATIERHHPGHEIGTQGKRGWGFEELDLVDERAGGASLAERDALKLLAVFLQHGDNRPNQQAFVCQGEATDRDCEEPLMYIHDVGSTFGAAGKLSRDAVAKFNFAHWSAKRVWKDEAGCVGELTGALNGSLDHPRIREAGRRFLADLLARLSDQQLTDLFEGAHAENRIQKLENADRNVAVADWVAAFKAKRAQIEDRRCPE